MSNLNQLIPAFQTIGLEVNQLKCELITLDETQENIAVETEPAHNSHLSAAQQLFQATSKTPLADVTLLCASIKLDGISESLSLIKTTTETLITRCYNVQLSDDAWTQASLTLRLGGIRTRRMADIALPAYISSMDVIRELVDQARLLATASSHIGAWLSALPIECLGLLLPDDAVRIGMALRLGVPVQQPHRCKCDGMTNKFGHHSLSCHHNP
ncbi:hypothetical protein Pcinc_014919 [Petrolisthes cinctipes]|uniref:Uncharacterized protein n=1 Tax=Petrolisthes cinctipes TaxID=88211 RepID=A0AAE1KQZ3_PETCI|nr:hypothetical protein Pcinc_014919 [Petrolisthes cinctipes]